MDYPKYICEFILTGILLVLIAALLIIKVIYPSLEGLTHLFNNFLTK
jgi:hypothetical protein